MKNSKTYWDNFDDELLEEFIRQKGIFKVKRQKLRKQIFYN